MISNHVIDGDREVNQMIGVEKVDLDLVVGQEIGIEVVKNQEIESKNHAKMILPGIEDRDPRMIEGQIEIDDHDPVLEKEKLKMKHLWIHFVLLIKQLKMTKETVDAVIMIDRLQVLHLLLTRIMTLQKPNELDKRVVPEAVLGVALQNASQEVEHQNVVHAAVVLAEVEIVEIEVTQEKNRPSDRDVLDQDHAQDRKKNEKHQQKI